MVRELVKWKELKLSNILSVMHGKNQRHVEVDISKFPILGSGGRIGWAKEPLCEEPSVLIGRKGTINNPQFIDKPFWTIDTLFYTEIKNDNNPRYIYYLFQTIDWLSLNEASGVPSLSAKNIENVKVKIPELYEQQKIAGMLSDMDELIDALEKIINKKKKIKQGTMQQLLTGKKRLSGFNSSWLYTKIRDICSYQNGKSLESMFNKEGGYKVISIGNYSTSGTYVNNNTYISYENHNLVSSYLLKKDDLTMILNDKTSDGSILGRVLYINIDSSYVFNQRTMRLVPKNMFNSKFLYYKINSGEIHDKIVNLSKPGTQIYINTNDVLDLELSIPYDYNEQYAIASILTDMDDEIEALETKLEKYKQIKEGMMQELLTGRIRLV